MQVVFREPWDRPSIKTAGSPKTEENTGALEPSLLTIRPLPRPYVKGITFTDYLKQATDGQINMFL